MTGREPLCSCAIRGERLECHAFRPEWRGSFAALNRAWLTHYFAPEPADEALLEDPEGRILAMGGEVFFASLAGEVVGTCALLPLEPGVWEVAKLAVDPCHQGLGIGRILIGLAVDAARHRSAYQVVARTNARLQASCHLFTSSGFRDEGPDASGDYLRESLRLVMDF